MKIEFIKKKEKVSRKMNFDKCLFIVCYKGHRLFTKQQTTLLYNYYTN